MKISTRILITLVLSLAIFGSTIIGISYVNTLKNEKMFLEEIPERPDNITGQKHRFELVD